MRRALEIARRGTGRVSPNPLVGAVLTDASGHVLAEGHHARFGGIHAERALLARIGCGRRVPKDAIFYVTLEPCVHHGKTPPCVDALLEFGIQRFVVAVRDPDLRTAGRGIRGLRAAGREVRVGLLREEARGLNPAFFLANEAGRARVTLKIASSLDGKLADFAGRSRWITGPRARGEVARLRGACDAVVVGSGTVEVDDPRLRSHSAELAAGRIVIASRLDIDPDCRLARIWRRESGRSSRGAEGASASDGAIGNWVPRPKGSPGRARWVRRPRLIVATASPSKRRRELFHQRGWEIWDLPDQSGGKVDLMALAHRSAAEGLMDLLVEPGPRLASGFLMDGPVDRILLFIAPMILGGSRGWTADLPARALGRAIRAAVLGAPRFHGPDLALEIVSRNGSALGTISTTAGRQIR